MGLLGWGFPTWPGAALVTFEAPEGTSPELFWGQEGVFQDS